MVYGVRFLEGRIRRELWYPAKIKLHWFRTSDDELDLYVPIEYYLDADIHWNYTIRAIRYFIYGELKVDSDLNRKLNPEFYDKEGRFRYSEFEKLNENYGYVSWFEFNTSRCDMIEFFFITGAQPPTDLTFAFEEEPLWKFDETEPITPYNYPIKRNKNKEIFQYFVEKFNR